MAFGQGPFLGPRFTSSHTQLHRAAASRKKGGTTVPELGGTVASAAQQDSSKPLGYQTESDTTPASTKPGEGTAI